MTTGVKEGKKNEGEGENRVELWNVASLQWRGVHVIRVRRGPPSVATARRMGSLTSGGDLLETTEEIFLFLWNWWRGRAWNWWIGRDVCVRFWSLKLCVFFKEGAYPMSTWNACVWIQFTLCKKQEREWNITLQTKQSIFSKKINIAKNGLHSNILRTYIWWSFEAEWGAVGVHVRLHNKKLIVDAKNLTIIDERTMLRTLKVLTWMNDSLEKCDKFFLKAWYAFLLYLDMRWVFGGH